MLILKNLTERAGLRSSLCERFIGPSRFFRRFLRHVPRVRRQIEGKRERKKKKETERGGTRGSLNKFRKSREIYSRATRAAPLYPIPKIRVLSDHLRGSHPWGNFILSFSRLPLAAHPLKSFFLLSVSLSGLRRPPVVLRGRNSLIYLTLKIGRLTSPR